MKEAHPCNKEADIAEIKTHVIYIREYITTFATKKELSIHRWLIGGLATSVLALLIGR